jgi:hypothetical protein
MKAKSIKGKTVEEIENRLDELIKNGFHPTLALVFTSVYHDKGKIRTVLSKHKISIFGATALGEFIDGELEDTAIVVMLLGIDRTNFRILFKECGIGKERESAQYIARKGLESYSNPVFIVCGSNIKADGEMIIRGIIDLCGPDVNIFGGMAGNQPFEWGGDIFVFTNEKESDFGIVALVLDGDNITTHGMASCGWKAVGTTKTVTKSDGCWVQTIEDEPALDMLIKYLGVDNKDSELEFDPIPEIGSDYPLQVEKADGSFVMRTPMSANWKERSFMCAGTVVQGSKIRFSLPADLNVIQTVIAENKEVKENHFPDAEALIVFSCYARLASFGPLIQKEVQGIKDIWNVPMAGFFTYGEFGGATGGGQEFHNITCSWVAIKEK